MDSRSIVSAKTKIVLVIAYASLSGLLGPRTALAFHMTGVCSNVTCTGGAPVLNGGGTGLNHPEIVPIFWGSYWNTSSNPSRGQMVGVIQAVTNGPYLAALAQYGANGNLVGPARMVPTAPIYTATTPVAHCANGVVCTANNCSDHSFCGDADVHNTLNTIIGTGVVPGPAQNADILYVVFVPPGFTSFDVNFRDTCTSSCGSAFNGKPYNFAWVNGDVGGLTHEMVESIAGNATDTNCTYTGGAPANQVADLCSCYSSPELGGNYSAYWSQADGECVVPEGWSGVWQYSNTPGTWTAIGGPVRQAYAGGNNILVTSTSDNPYLYSGTPGQWSQIGAPGAMYAVGSGGPTTIIGTSTDMSTVYKYVSGTTWTTISTTGASSVFAGGSLLETDFGGNAYLYAGTPNNWTNVSSPADQFAVDGVGLTKLALDHQSSSGNVSGTLSGWTTIGGAASELFIGSGNSLAARDLTTSKHIWYYEGGTSWVQNGGAGVDFAVTGNATLFSVSTSGNAVLQSSNTAATLPSWNVIGGTAGRLIGHGNNLYAVTGITY